MNIKEIAKLADVSISTVSRVVNNQPGVKSEIREKVKAIVKENNYVANAVAVNLLKKKTNTVGIILPYVHSFYSGRIEAITEVCKEKGYSIMIASSKGNFTEEIKNFQLMMEKQVDGIIFFATEITKEHVEIIKNIQDRIPIVITDSESDEIDVPFVLQDNYGGARSAMKYLIANGHRKIGFIGGPIATNDAKERLRAYIDVLKENEIEIDEDIMYEGRFSMKSGYEGGFEILKKNEGREMPTAIFTANDTMAIGLLRALHELGLSSPSDISIVSIDDIEIIRYTIPALSTVKQSQEETGKMAAELLMEYIEHKKFRVKKSIMEQKLVERESVKKI